LGNIVSLNLCWQLGEEQLLSIRKLLLPLLKVAMPFGNHSLLKSESDFSNILSLNLCWRLGEEQSLSGREHLATWQRTIAKYSRACTIAKQAMPFGNHSLLKKAKAISVLF
jgi:hypothetical protein